MNENNIIYIKIIGIIGMLFALFAGRLAGKFGLLNILRSALCIAVIGMICVGPILFLPKALI